MPDYHAMCQKEKVSKVFWDTINLLNEFYKDLGIQDHMVPIFRYTTEEGEKIIPLKDLPENSWVEHGNFTEETRPYFRVKYEVNYTGCKAPVQLGTVQIDDDLPKKYNVNGVLIHFSMGSLERLVAVLEAQNLSPALGLELITLGNGSSALKTIQEKIPYPLKWTSVRGSHSLSKALRGSVDFLRYPWVLLVGPEELKQGTVRLLNRKKGTEQIVSLSMLRSKLVGERILTTSPSVLDFS